MSNETEGNNVKYRRPVGGDNDLLVCSVVFEKDKELTRAMEVDGTAEREVRSDQLGTNVVRIKAEDTLAVREDSFTKE